MKPDGTKVIPEGYTEFNHEFFDNFKGEDVKFSFHFKSPSSPQIKRAQKKLLKDSMGSLKILCLDVILPEEKENFKKAIEKYPGLCTTFGGELLKASGFGDMGNG